MTTDKATPKWTVDLSDRLSDGTDCLYISDGEGNSIAEMMCPKEDEERLANQIVHCVNHFDGVVAALETLYHYQQAISSPDTRWELPVYAAARRALAAVKGKDRNEIQQ